MEYIKEREYIVAYDSEGKYAGKWNILTGEFYGMKGHVIKNAPKAMSMSKVHDERWHGTEESKIFAGALEAYHYYHSHSDWFNLPWEHFSSKLEQVISVKLMVTDIFNVDFDFKLNKTIIQYIREKNSGWFNRTNYETAVAEITHSQYLVEQSPEVRVAFQYGIRQNVPVDFLKTFLNRCEREQIVSFVCHFCCESLGNFMVDYYRKCREMYGSVKVEPHLLSNYAHICALYKQYQDKNRDAILKYNNDLDWLYFSNGEYQAVPLKNSADFHREAEAQHNCVERIYMQKVLEGNTHVVAVRKVDDPERSVITCEVGKSGAIIQYLGFANSRRLTNNQLEFRNQYAQHLAANVK